MKETTLGERLLPFVQLLPAVMVAIIVLVTLPLTAPVLAELPERLSPPAPVQETAPEPEEEAEPAPSLLPYADGIYTGSSRGYGGAVKVQVTMADGRMTEIQIVSASHETASFLKRAKRLLGIMLDAQTWEVDAISEATYSSRGILGAVKNALTGEEVINPRPPQPKTEEPPVVEAFTPPSAYRDGVYTASAQGYGGLITVQVTLSGDTITDISIVDASEESHSYFTRARRVVSAVLDSQSPEVDTISGATYSSTGILNAIRLALASASTETAPTADPPVESIVEEPAASQEQDAASVASEVVAPTVEVVHTEEKTPSLLERAREFLASLFPEQPAESKAESGKSTSEITDNADVADSAAPAQSEVSEDAQTEGMEDATDEAP